MIGVDWKSLGFLKPDHFEEITSPPGELQAMIRVNENVLLGACNRQIIEINLSTQNYKNFYLRQRGYTIPIFS